MGRGGGYSEVWTKKKFYEDIRNEVGINQFHKYKYITINL